MLKLVKQRNLFCIAILLCIPLLITIYVFWPEDHLKTESPHHLNQTVETKAAPISATIIFAADKNVTLNSQDRSLIDNLMDQMGMPDEYFNNYVHYLPYYKNVVIPICDTLRTESTQDSVKMLHQIAEYQFPGSDPIQPCSLPLLAENGTTELEKVMSNRRFLKILAELGTMSKSQAASVVNQEIDNTLPLYLSMLDEQVEHFKQAGKVQLGSKISNNEDRSPVFQGLRLKLLALVFTAGNLELEQSQTAIQEVAKAAISQRKRWYYSKDFSKIDRAAILIHQGIYNRQILVTGLYGTYGFSEQEIDSVSQKNGLPFQERKLTLYDSSATPYDHFTRLGMIPADFSKGKQIIRFPEPMDDKTFDLALKAMDMDFLLEV